MAMRIPSATLSALILAAALSAGGPGRASTLAAAQQGERPRAPAKNTPAPSKAPRTPDGHPDLQGTWTNGTLTPFERPVGLENKAFISDEEAAALERAAV